MMHPMMWIIHAYQLIFALSSMIFEAKQEWVNWLKMLESYKAMLIENAKFLAKALGRGLFYIFQGTLWLVLGYSVPVGEDKTPGNLSQLYHFLALILGLFMFVVGGAHVLMHWGIMPSNYALALNNAGGAAGDRLNTAMTSFRERRAAEDEESMSERPSVELTSRNI